jgi:hypothetical protein
MLRPFLRLLVAFGPIGLLTVAPTLARAEPREAPPATSASAGAGAAPGAGSSMDFVRAQRLFNEGLERREAGEIAAACDRFEAARSLLETPFVLLAVADCHAELGKTTSAVGDYERAAIAFDAAGRSADASAARARSAALRPHIPFLRVFLDPQETADAIVTENGARLSAGMLGAALPVNAGAHTIEVTGPGLEPYRTTVTVVDGAGTHDVRIPRLEKKAAPDSPRPPTATAPGPTLEADQAPTARTGGPGRSRLPMYVALGFTATGVVAATAASITSAVLQAKARDRCPENTCEDAAGVRHNEAAIAAYRYALVGGTVAVVGGALSGYLAWSLRVGGEDTTPTAARPVWITPWATPQQAGFAARHRF